MAVFVESNSREVHHSLDVVIVNLEPTLLVHSTLVLRLHYLNEHQNTNTKIKSSPLTNNMDRRSTIARSGLVERPFHQVPIENTFGQQCLWQGSDCKNIFYLSNARIINGCDSLFIKIFLDLFFIYTLHRYGSPKLLKRFINFDFCTAIIVEYHHLNQCVTKLFE